jgi:hypothetical protein
MARKAAKEAANAKIKIQYYRSVIAFPKTQKGIVRGAVAKVPHLLRIVE